MHYNLDIILFQIISGQFRSVSASFGQFRSVSIIKTTCLAVMDSRDGVEDKTFEVKAKDKTFKAKVFLYFGSYILQSNLIAL